MSIGFLDALTTYFDFLWSSFLLLAPMLLLGLLLSGLIHVFISRQAILRYLKDDSLKSVSTSAAIGVPVPLCSCSVVPVVAEMRNKGASRSACMSFLITAPETGADSILVTNAFFGWIVAIVRPVVSFITAVVAGVFCIGLIRDGRDEPEAGDHDHGHSHEHGHDHDHGVHKPLIEETSDCYISPSRMKMLLLAWVRGFPTMFGKRKLGFWIKPDFYREPEFTEDKQPAPSPADESDLDFRKIVKHILRYGFVEIADDILFALLVGVALGGLLYLVIPSDLMANEYARWLSYPIMVLIGVPLYICASASTPIAAALVAKGFSPGAAMVFLMTGPATNTGTIAIIMSQFGTRFASIYVSVVIVVTVILGILIDVLLLATGLTISVNLDASDSTVLWLVQWGGAFALIALIIWRFRAGALHSGYEDLLLNVRPLSRPWKRVWGRLTRNRSFTGIVSPTTPMGMMLYSLVLALFLGSGFTTVPPGHVGYGLLFGKVHWKDLSPGLHYLAPRPFVQVDKWPVQEVKSIMASDPYEYLSGDLNMLTLTMNVQYRVNDPHVWHYGTKEPDTIVENAVRDQVRAFVSARDLDQLLTSYRDPLEREIATLFETPGDDPRHAVFNSIDLIKVNLLDINPVAESMNSFREISSAQEDRERFITDAQRFMVSLIPQAHGNAVYEVEQARGKAFRKVAASGAEANAISTISTAMQTAPAVLRNMLWREKLETALSGNTKIIAPNLQSFSKVALWKKKSAQTGAETHHDQRADK